MAGFQTTRRTFLHGSTAVVGLAVLGLAECFDLEATLVPTGVRAVPEQVLPIGEVYRLPGEPASVHRILAYIDAVAQRVGFSEAGVEDILLAVGEAAMNAVRHGSPRAGQSEIAVRCQLEETERMVIEVMDQGHGFDPLSVPAPTPEQMRGCEMMGIFIMRLLMDEVTFDCGVGGTTVRLVKCRK